MRPNWEQYFMIIAKIVSLRSTCNSRPGGAIIVSPDNRILTTGYTGSISGAFQCSDEGDDFCYRRSVNAPDIDKYNICKSVHSEQNTLAQAAKHGIAVIGCRMFCTLQPCYICLKLLASSGLTAVYFETLYTSSNNKRDESWRRAFDELNIVCKQITLTEENQEKAIKTIKYQTSLRRLLPTE